mgnify:FL=1
MASLIPAIGTCVSRMTGGEKRLAQRLENKLEEDWLIWYDVPLGPRKKIGKTGDRPWFSANLHI